MNIPTSSEKQMVNLTIDGNAVSVPIGTTVYQAAKQLKIDIPVFCYLDRMPPFGACRMCLVQVDKMPKLQTSCTLEAVEGMVVHTQASEAVKGRESILEFLLINHPLDCPICDKGGECPLQDHAYNHGPGLSRFFEEKRRFKKPIPLGPVLMLDRERCIVCARCTRFGDLIAGDHALEMIERGFKTEVGTSQGKPVESKFIGNTISICPVGALTSQVYRFRARPWDNIHTPSTCTLCPVGCSSILDSRDGEIMRTRAQENKAVNDIWLCDKGWFGYEFSSSTQRLTQPLIRRNGQLEPATWEEALNLIKEKLQTSKAHGKIGAIGGNPLTCEENYLYQKLFRDYLGTPHLDHRLEGPLLSLQEEGLMPGMEMAIGETEELSYAFLLGLDLTEEFPVIWLRLKQAINNGAKVIFMGHFAPEIAPHLEQTLLHSPGQELEMIHKHLSAIQDLSKNNSKGALFVGRQYLSSPLRLSILSKLLEIQEKTPHLTLNIMEGNGNSLGARLAGMRPDLGPGQTPLTSVGYNTQTLVDTIAAQGWDYLHIAGANPARKFPSILWSLMRQKLKFMVVQDIFLTETAEQADVVLPTLSYVEKEGTFINIEGRRQKLLPGKEIPENIYSDADIFIKIAIKLGYPLSLDSTYEQLVNQPNQLRRSSKLNNTLRNDPDDTVHLKASFAHSLFDQGVRMKHNSHLIKLAKPPSIRMHPDEALYYQLDEGDLISVVANKKSIEGRLHLDQEVARGTVVLPLGFDDIPTQNLGFTLFNGMAVEIHKLSVLPQ